ncbi:MAG: TonB-dependent receptor [Myxococcales bacterium]|nr:TonB-dependent receptor [Myxococcales bacterium]
MRQLLVLTLVLALAPVAARAQTSAPQPAEPRTPPTTNQAPSAAPDDAAHDDEATEHADSGPPPDEQGDPAAPDAGVPAGDEAGQEDPGEEPSTIDLGALSDELADEAEAEEAAERAERGRRSSGEPDDDDSADSEEDEDDDWVLDVYEVRAPVDPFRTGGSVQQLSAEVLDAYDYDDINSALQQVPGVYVRQEDGFGLRPNIGLRGTTPDRSRKVTLMEDGVLFGPAPYSAPAAYYFPIFSRMVGVDIYKGPAAVLFGPNTIAGAINLRTREVPTEPEGAFELSYGRFQYRRAHFHYGGSTRHAGILFEGVHLGTTGFRDIDAGDPDTGFNRSEFMLRSFVQTTPGEAVFNRLELKLGFSRERSNETYTGLSDADFQQNPYRRYAATQLDRMTWWRTQVELRHHLVIGEHVDFVTTAYRHDFQRTWRRLNRFVGERDGTGPSLFDVLTNPTGARDSYYRVLSGQSDSSDFGPDHDLLVVSNARAFISEGIQTELHATFGESVEQELTIGLRLHHDEINRDHVERAYSLEALQLVANGDDPTTITRNIGSATALAGHAAYSMTYRGLTVKPGIRLESIRATLRDLLAAGGPRSSTQTYVVVLPGLGLTYAFTDSFAALAGIHRGFSPLGPGAGAGVEVETSIAYEAGVRYRDEDAGLNAEVIGFVNDYQQFVTQCGGSGGCDAEDLDRQFNAGDVLIGGVELQATYNLELGRDLTLPMHLSYTYTHAEFRTTFTESADPQLGNVRIGDPVPYVPEHQWSLQLGLEADGWAVHTSGTFVGEMPEIADNSIRTDRYLIVDVTGSYRVLDRFDITLRLENLTNAQPLVSRRPFGARPYRPFMVQVGVEVDL